MAQYAKKCLSATAPPTPISFGPNRRPACGGSTSCRFCLQALKPREISVEEYASLQPVAYSPELTVNNVKGAVLAVPKTFYYDADDAEAPDCWGYVVKVGRQEKKADRTAYFLNGHDGSSAYYLEPHPKFTESERNRFLQHPDVNVLKIGK